MSDQNDMEERFEHIESRLNILESQTKMNRDRITALAKDTRDRIKEMFLEYRNKSEWTLVELLNNETSRMNSRLDNLHGMVKNLAREQRSNAPCEHPILKASMGGYVCTSCAHRFSL